MAGAGKFVTATSSETVSEPSYSSYMTGECVGVQATIRVTVEVEGQDRPACVVETISRYYPEA